MSHLSAIWKRTRGSGDDTYRQQPPHIRRLIDAMQTIFDDASKLAAAIRRGRSLASSAPADPALSPIRCSAPETLFEHTGENDEKGTTQPPIGRRAADNLLTLRHEKPIRR
jgi:hypothetical protein